MKTVSKPFAPLPTPRKNFGDVVTYVAITLAGYLTRTLLKEPETLFYFEAYIWCAVYSSRSRLIIFWYCVLCFRASSLKNSTLALLKIFIFSRQ